MSVRNWLQRLLGASLSEPTPIKHPDGQSGEVEHSARDARVDAAVNVILSNPEADQDQLRALLAGCGFAPPDAWRASQFLPMAFTHVVFRNNGVSFQPSCVLVEGETGIRSTLKLADEPMYSAAVASAEALLAEGCTPQQLLPVFGRSAEWNVIGKLVAPDGRLDGIVLTEPLIIMPSADS